MKPLCKVELGIFPTPVVKLARLSAELGGPEIHMKRDDLTGLALGGNKTRKLEFLMRQAVETGCDTVITAGAGQSNHCCQTAAAAAKLNLECHLVLGGEAPESADGNLLLDQLFGAQIHWAGEHRKGEDIPELVEQLKSAGKTPYAVPYGGSNAIGAYGFYHAMEELEGQMDVGQLTHIVFASSSGGTHAGLLLGKTVFKRDYKLIGINIDKDQTYDIPLDVYIVELANKTSRLMDAKATVSEDGLILNNDFVGEGYGVVGELEKEAISLVARCEGILLDPVYTGRAMGGLIRMIRTKQIAKDDKVLFWHTGGTPSVFAYAAALGANV